ncbi:hypothetical protein C8Q70DRAFT_560984 [Cubamyces menziesii]|nr:hypothetical protein C8Q70DRAFT_560984 [Cubamyces menziesii]
MLLCHHAILVPMLYHLHFFLSHPWFWTFDLLYGRHTVPLRTPFFAYTLNLHDPLCTQLLDARPQLLTQGSVSHLFPFSLLATTSSVRTACVTPRLIAVIIHTHARPRHCSSSHAPSAVCMRRLLYPHAPSSSTLTSRLYIGVHMHRWVVMAYLHYIQRLSLLSSPDVHAHWPFVFVHRSLFSRCSYVWLPTSRFVGYRCYVHNARPRPALTLICVLRCLACGA